MDKSRKSDTVFNNHQLVDSVRGQVSGNWQALYSNETDANSNYIALVLTVLLGAGTLQIHLLQLFSQEQGSLTFKGGAMLLLGSQ